MTVKFQPNAILLAMLGALASAGAFAEDRIMFTTGDVQIRDAGGQLRAAAKGMEIRPGDTIVTTVGGYVQAKMETGFMAVRPETQVKLDSLPATRSPGAGVSSQVTLLQGAVRMIAAEQGGAGLGKVAAPAPATMVVQTQNANVSLKNSDGEVGIALPKSAGAVPTTVSLVNSGTMLVKGDIGTAVPVAANMAAAVTGSALPNVTTIAAAPMLTAMVQKPPLVTLQPPSATLPATDATGGKTLTQPIAAPVSPALAPLTPVPVLSTGKLPAVGGVVTPAPMPTAPAVSPAVAPAVAPAPIAIAPVTAPVPIMLPKPVISPVIAPMPVVAPIIAPKLVVAPIVVTPPVVVAPVIAPKTILSPIRTCSTLLINGVRTTVCK